MVSLIVLFLAVLIISFLCSLVESVFISTTHSFVALAVKDEEPFGPLLAHLKENVNKPITAIITFNTLSNTLGSALLATVAYEEFGNIGVSIVTGVLTLGILIISEILPKVIGATYWKILIPYAVYVIQAMIMLIYPIVWISEYATQKIRDDDMNGSLTREEMIASAEQSAEEGEIKKQEGNIIKNLLTLSSLFVADIMTPRSVIFALSSESTVAEIFNKYKPIRFSRIPVYEESLDHIVGVTMRYQIHEAVSNDQDSVKLKDILTPATTVSEKMTVAGLLEFLIKKKIHLAVVVDEYGIVTGLVSLEDAIETLLGVEIVDELDHVTDMRQYALDQWALRKGQVRRN